MSKQSAFSKFAGLFNVPNIVGKKYAPGWQPNNPGESSTPGWPGASMQVLPWPDAVPVLNTLANNPGIPRARAPVPVVDRYADSPENYLFIGGAVSKSQG